jgi:putative transposase
VTDTGIYYPVGTDILIEGEEWRVHSYAQGGDFNLYQIEHNKFWVRTVVQMLELYAAGKIKLAPKKRTGSAAKRAANLELPLASWSDKRQKEVIRRHSYLTKYLDLNPRQRKKTEKVLTALAADVANKIRDSKQLSVHQFRRVIGFWEEAGCPEYFDVRILGPQTHLRGLGREHFHPAVEAIALDVLRENYVVQTKESLQDVRLEVLKRAKGLDTSDFAPKFMKGGRPKTPSKSTLHRMYLGMPTDIRVEGRYGGRVRKKIRVLVGPGPVVERALERVEGDATSFDYILVDYEKKIPIGRADLILWIDCATRCIVAYDLDFEHHSAKTVLRSAAMMMSPKTYMATRYPDIKHPWFAWGKPEEVTVDQGKPFTSEEFVCYLLEHGIDFNLCPPASPNFKATVESGIRTLLKKFVHKIDGTTFSNIFERGDYDSESESFLDIKDMHWAIHKWINDIYHRTVHRSLGMTPAQKWAECVKQHKPATPADPEKVNLLARNFAFGKITREGIEFKGLKYSETPAMRRELLKRAESKEVRDRIANSPTLNELFNRTDLPPRVKFFYGDPDMSFIEVEDWRDGKLIRVLSTQLEYTEGLTYRQHCVGYESRKRKKKNNEDIATEELMEEQHDLRETLEKLNRRYKTSRRIEATFGKDKTLRKSQSERENGGAPPPPRPPETYHDAARKPKRPSNPSPLIPNDTRAKIASSLKADRAQSSTTTKSAAALGISSNYKKRRA